MLEFIAGLFIGSTVTLVVMCMFIVGSQGDRE